MFNLSFKNLIIVIAITFLEWSIESSVCNARNQSLAGSSIFNVVKYGARGDGKTDDTKAFLAAWRDVCKVQGSTLLVPSPFVFLVNPITFLGSGCKSQITFQMHGNIIAPRNAQAWASKPQAWLIFESINSLTVQGRGTFDGQGSIWWTSLLVGAASPQGAPTLDVYGSNYINSGDDWQGYEKLQGQLPSAKPVAILIAKSSNVVVTGITIKNSPSKHLKIFACVGAKIFGINIASPGNSPNTDGINLANSQHVIIHNVNLACGDDCISILGGCSDVTIYQVNCGPGHGFSIGGLGRGHTRDIVSGITVRDSFLQNSLFGVRIKTFQGGSGLVKQVNFTNIQVTAVQIPIIIDQYYCNGNQFGCKNETSAVAISGITYNLIRGTYTTRPISFQCSDSSPCRGLTLSNIDLRSSKARFNTPLCYKAFGNVLTKTTPPITCLQRG